MQRLLLLGLNHTTAPLDVRERVAFNGAQRTAAMADFRARFPGCELVILSTCNRVELYAARAVHERPTLEDLTQFLARFHNIAPQALQPHLYQRAQRDVVEHLFRVTASLDSMVLGETQILGQVREAYDLASAGGMAGPELHPLFQRATAVGKQVVRDTALSDGRVSVASVAVDYARQIYEHFNDKTVLAVGAGKMTSLVLQSFKALSPGRVMVCNRTHDKAVALASKFGGEAVSFERLREHLVAADIVVTSTGAAQPIITRAGFDSLLRERRYRPIFLIDIAVPRDIESAVGELDHVYLYNLDDLQQVVMRTHSQRTAAVDSAAVIVRQHVDEYIAWNRRRDLGPAIANLYARYHQIAQDEVSRTLNKLPDTSAAERSHLEDLARRIVNKLLHDPVQVLRQTDTGASHSNTQYLHALEKLFQLSQPSAPPEAGLKQPSDAAQAATEFPPAGPLPGERGETPA